MFYFSGLQKGEVVEREAEVGHLGVVRFGNEDVPGG
jgi:hypothetical protein